jgi:hypothetical protein
MTYGDVTMYTRPNPRPAIKRPRMSMPYVFGTRCTTTLTIMKKMEKRSAQSLPTKPTKVTPIQSCAKQVVAHDTAAIVRSGQHRYCSTPRAAHL